MQRRENKKRPAPCSNDWVRCRSTPTFHLSTFHLSTCILVIVSERWNYCSRLIRSATRGWCGSVLSRSLIHCAASRRSKESCATCDIPSCIASWREGPRRVPGSGEGNQGRPFLP